MIKKAFCLLSLSIVFVCLNAQQSVKLGAGSYASYAPLSESRWSIHGGSQAYQTEHRRLYLPDSLLAKLGAPNATKEGTLALPTNDWWTYALVNQWTGKLWFYPGWAEGKNGKVEIGFPSYWEPTGCEVKWDTPLSISFTNTQTGQKAAFKETLVDAWSDFMMSFIMQDGNAWVRVTVMHGSPLVWVEAEGIEMSVTNPNAGRYTVLQRSAAGKNLLTVGLLTNGLSAQTVEQYAWRIPRKTEVDYSVHLDKSYLATYFRIYTQDVSTTTGTISKIPCLMGFLPHHYFSTEDGINPNLQVDETPFMKAGGENVQYMSPRGTMRLAQGNDFCFNYPVNGILPFFPAPIEWKDGFSEAKMRTLASDYALRGTFGADTYWGGKGLTQMMHYMTFALQMGDEATYKLAKSRLRASLENWYTYTAGEQNMYFARYPRWGAMVGFDPSYDSDTFNDHHFHYGYFVYASAVLCMLDEDFREKYGAMVREVAMDYANWLRDDPRNPLFRTFDPYCGHSFAGGMGNEGNGNGQESSSEAMQSWGGIWMLGAALGDKQMMDAGIFGYTVEAKATAEYWFDRHRRNIDYTKYTHPYCCNLTMQGVGWWTWFSGDPVWMHSIQWLPTSPILTNYFSIDLNFTRWDYTQMYAGKEIGNYEAATNGLGDESGLGNVCLSYLALFDADSAAHVWEKMDAMGKALARNTDTGGITYWLAHSHRSLGEKRFDILSDWPLACAYTDTLTGITTYAIYNTKNTATTVHFFGAKDTTFTVPASALTLYTDANQSKTISVPADEEETYTPDEMAWNLPYPNLALHKPVTVSSFENAGCVAVNLTDGDIKTRWGSTHHDGEYAIVDLGQQCYIDHLILRWEAAYASRYEIALSDDEVSWRTVTFTSGGGVEEVALAKAYSAINQPSRGRYIRITGLERATTYGTSLYELEAYGRPLHGTAGELFAIALSASDTVVQQGQTTLLSAQGYDALGNPVEATYEYAIRKGIGQLQGSTLLCNTYGEVEVTASSGDKSAALTIIVLETEVAIEAQAQPSELTLPLGEDIEFITTIVDQYGGAIDTCLYFFRATQLGDTSIILDCLEMSDTALLHIVSYGDLNLALGKDAEASSAEDDGKSAGKVTDGNLDTRWGSQFNDNEWVAIDLGDCYLLTTVKLYWENAYATSYDIEISDNGINYTTAKAITGAQGGVQTIDIRDANQNAVSARYVRIFCKTRNTGYGSSLYEVEVYGESKCEQTPTAIETTILKDSQDENSYKFIRNGKLYIRHSSGAIYDATGKQINTK